MKSLRPRKGQRLQVRFVGYDAGGQALGWWQPARAAGQVRSGEMLPAHSPPASRELPAHSPPASFELRAPFGARDDLAEVEILHVSPHRQVAWARILRVLSPSPHRALPFDHPGHRCGGCSFAHLTAQEQLWAKGERFATLAARFPGAALASPKVRPSERETAYRNRGKYVIGRAAVETPPGPRARLQGSPEGDTRHSENSKPVLGAFAPRSHQVIRTLGCPVMEPAVERAATALEALLGETCLSLYDEARGEGLLRYAAIRSNHRGEVLVTLVTAEDPARQPVAQDMTPLVTGLAQRVPGLVGVTLDVNPTRGNVLFSGQGRVLRGAGVLEERYGPARVGLTGQGFGQVNREQAAALYRAAAVAALAPLASRAPGGPRRIWELYAGAGALAQVIAHEARDRGMAQVLGVEQGEARLLGVERDEAAVEQANLAARELGLSDRLRFVAADAGAVLEPRGGPVPARGSDAGDWSVEPPDVVALDPPRTGCSPELIKGLCRARVPRVVYVSCDPDTLCRDLGLLESGGYAVRQLAGFDMMPQTPHLEMLAVAEWVAGR